MFSMSGWHLTGLMLASRQLSALRTALLLGLPVSGAAVVTAQRIGAVLVDALLNITLLPGV